MKLNKAQERALAKLTDKWQSNFTLRESIATLRALCLKGLADYDSDRWINGRVHYGSMFRKKQTSMQ
jgi:hypothetical protein